MSIAFFRRTCLVLLALPSFSRSDPLQSLIRKLNIRLIAPSSGCSPEIYQKVKEYLKLPVMGPNYVQDYLEVIFEKPDIKAQRLDKALRSSADILWALRGGYGLNKILPLINRLDYKNVKPKILVGYSDTAALLLYFSQKYGWKGIHGCNFYEICTWKKSSLSRQLLVNFLSGQANVLTLEGLTPLNHSARQATKICGYTTGGNLTILQDSLGTPWQVVGEDRIIFVEDVNVHGHYLDRALNHLRNAGVLQRARALGDFSQEDLAVIRVFSDTLPIPVFQTPLFGHGDENHPIGIHFWGRIIRSSGGSFSVSMTRTR